MTCVAVTPVQKFYKDSEIFLTGGTGFIGKLTIEKILRSCPDVGRIFVLIRPKKGLTVDERKMTLFNAPVFDRLKQEKPDALDKIVFVPGDCSAPRLGLSDTDYHDLTQHVNIVLHLAATVRFNESLKVAMNVNVRGTMEIIKLCHECVSLKAGVFVSTAFANCNRHVVEEKFYDPPPVQYEDMLKLLDVVSERDLEILSHKISGSWHIPYLFSKAVMENLISRYAKGLPVSVVRPSMIVSTIREPMEGWVDNMYGPIAIVCGVASGVLRVNNIADSVVLDGIPADMVCNCILSVAATTNTRSSDDVKVYNATVSDRSRMTVKKVLDTYLKIRDTYPLKRAMWYPFMLSVSNFKLYTLLSLLLHVLPGYVGDLALRLKGQQPMLIKVYKKIRMFAVITNQFIIKDMLNVSDNMINLYDNLDPEDKELFFFDTRNINWENFLTMSGLLSRKYVLNETLDDLDEARLLCRKLYYAHTTVKFLLYAVAIWVTWCILTYFASAVL